MTWEYLEQQNFDKRFEIIVQFLKGKTKDKVIVDLDCGSAKLCKFLEPDWLTYVGNDIDEKYIRMAKEHNVPKTSFYLKSDEHVDECTDILIVMGYGGQEITHAEEESKTLNSSIKRIVEKHQPEIVILEMIKPFSICMDDFKKFLESRGYKGLIHEVEINDKFKFVSTRIVGIFTYQGTQ